MYTRLSTAGAILLLGALLPGCSSTPPFQGMSGDELFELGAREFEAEDWDKAIRAFERFLYAEPTHPRLVQGRIYLARAYYNREDYITAASEFSRVLDRHPGDPLAPDAALGVCKAYVALSPHIQRDQSYTLQAFNSCDNVVQDFGGFEVAVEAQALRDQMEEKLARKTLVAGEFYYQRKLYDSGIIYFNDVLTEFPRTEAAAQALLRLYQSYTAIGWEREAGEARDRLLRDFPDSAAAQEVRANGGEGGEGGASGSEGARGAIPATDPASGIGTTALAGSGTVRD